MIGSLTMLAVGVSLGMGVGVLVILWPQRKPRSKLTPAPPALNLDGYPRCFDCGEIFLSPVLLSMHFAAKHTPPSSFDESFQCCFCGLFFASYRERELHEEGHREHPETMEPPQGCD